MGGQGTARKRAPGAAAHDNDGEPEAAHPAGHHEICEMRPERRDDQRVATTLAGRGG